MNFTFTADAAAAIKAKIEPLLKGGESVSVRTFGFDDGDDANLPREVVIKIPQSFRGRPTNPVTSLILAEDAASTAALKDKIQALRNEAKEKNRIALAVYKAGR